MKYITYNYKKNRFKIRLDEPHNKTDNICTTKIKQLSKLTTILGSEYWFTVYDHFALANVL